MGHDVRTMEGGGGGVVMLWSPVSLWSLFISRNCNDLCIYSSVFLVFFFCLFSLSHLLTLPKCPLNEMCVNFFNLLLTLTAYMLM